MTEKEITIKDNIEIEYDAENDDLIEVDYNFCTCPNWDNDSYGPPFGNLCVGCGKPIKDTNNL